MSAALIYLPSLRLVAGRSATTWLLGGLTGLLWLKLCVSALLREETGFLLSKLVDVAFVGPVLAYCFVRAGVLLRGYASVCLALLLVLLSVFVSELLAQRNLAYVVYALFDALKFLTPFLFLLVLLDLYRTAPDAVARAIRATVVLVFVLAIAGLALLPNEHNRAQQFLPAYFAGLHTSAYTVLLAAIAAYYLMLAGLLGRAQAVAIGMLAIGLVFFAWGVRTAMVGVAAFVLVDLWQRGWAARAALGYMALVALVAGYALLLFGVLRMPQWDELAAFSSGRTAMWEFKLRLFMGGSLSEAFFGKGAGSDFVYSQVWWWARKDSHNDFLKQLTEHGLVGLFAQLALLGAVLLRLREESRAVVPVFMTYLASSAISNGIMFRPLAGLVFAMALVAALHASRRDAGTRARS